MHMGIRSPRFLGMQMEHGICIWASVVPVVCNANGAWYMHMGIRRAPFFGSTVGADLCPQAVSKLRPSRLGPVPRLLGRALEQVQAQARERLDAGKS